MKVSKFFFFIFYVVIISSVLLFLHTIFYSTGWKDRIRAKNNLVSIQKENQDIQKKVDNLREQIHAIRNRTEVQEMIIRQEFGYIARDEIILKIK